MAEENQVTIFTDFDKSMVRQNSYKRFMTALLFRNPRGTFSQLIDAFRKYGTGGQAFIHAMTGTDQRTREMIAEWVAGNLTFNKRWVNTIRELVRKYPGIKNIKIVIITRNIALIPQIFIQSNRGWLRQMTGGKFQGDIHIIGNDLTADKSPTIAHEQLNMLNEHNAREITRLIIKTIDRSREKALFIKSRNAFYLGDKEEYHELSGHADLTQLHFQQV
jgi:hypothetical protein